MSNNINYYIAFPQNKQLHSRDLTSPAARKIRRSIDAGEGRSFDFDVHYRVEESGLSGAVGGGRY